MTTWRRAGKKSVKGKLKGQASKMNNKKALNLLRFKAFPLSFVDKKDVAFNSTLKPNDNPAQWCLWPNNQ